MSKHRPDGDRLARYGATRRLTDHWTGHVAIRTYPTGEDDDLLTPSDDRPSYVRTRRWLWLLAAVPPLLWVAAVVGGCFLIEAVAPGPPQPEDTGMAVLIVAAVVIPGALAFVPGFYVAFVLDAMPDETTRLRDVPRRDLRDAGRPLY